MALLEAAATGLPAVVTAVGGNRDLVLDGQTGHVVPPANPQALATAITRLMKLSLGERRALGNFARRHCLEHYRFEGIGEQWVRLYRSLMALNAAKSGPTMRRTCAVSED